MPLILPIATSLCVVLLLIIVSVKMANSLFPSSTDDKEGSRSQAKKL